MAAKQVISIYCRRLIEGRYLEEAAYLPNVTQAWLSVYLSNNRYSWCLDPSGACCFSKGNKGQQEAAANTENIFELGCWHSIQVIAYHTSVYTYAACRVPNGKVFTISAQRRKPSNRLTIWESVVYPSFARLSRLPPMPTTNRHLQMQKQNPQQHHVLSPSRSISSTGSWSPATMVLAASLASPTVSENTTARPSTTTGRFWPRGRPPTPSSTLTTLARRSSFSSKS